MRDEAEGAGRPAKGALAVASQALTALLVVTIWGVVLLTAGPVLLGRQSYMVLSGSMEPAFSAGAAVVVEPVAADQLQVKDIIAYVNDKGDIITHRVMMILEEPGGRQFITKGDANNGVDPLPVAAINVLGRVWYSVPAAGYLLGMVNQTEVRVLLGLAFLVLGLRRVLAWQTKRPASAEIAPERGAAHSESEAASGIMK
ncbi:MAG: signal peptidase I [Chloroflexi bacterium]|nr:signal peptidase I [Chloroflexota bacterium]